MRSISYPTLQGLTRRGTGLVTAFIWGVAEAVFWPILPDYLLFALCPLTPAAWWRFGVAASAGSVFGGLAAFGLAYARSSSFPLEFAPLITRGMIETARDWISTEGALAVMRQPLSGIPYKVFAYLSGSTHENPFVFVWASALARSWRIFLVAGAGALLGRIAGADRVARWYDLFLIVFSAVFAYGLWNVVRSFS